MKFKIEEKVFNTLDNLCIAFIVAKKIDNKENDKYVMDLLDNNLSKAQKELENVKIKEYSEILCYRNAFEKLSINPNKFLSSIEAILTRVSKGKGFPHINKIVDLVNALSIKYKLPMGSHDIDSMNDDFCVRYSVRGDKFLPFGETEIELLEDNELVYTCGNDIRTRRWIWRQSEYGKIVENTTNIIFPIDGFIGVNDKKVIEARDELETILKELFNCTTIKGFLSKENNESEEF